MQPLRKRTLFATAVGSLATIALAGALVIPMIANAQDATPNPEAPAVETVQRDRGARSGESDSALAEALGITVEELTAARAAARESAIAQALADGLITEEQATELRSDDSNGRGGLRHLMGDVDQDALLAGALGITEEELEAARDQLYAERVAAAVTAGDITQEEADLALARRALQEYITPLVEQSITDAVAAAVADGIITQEQADALTAEGTGFGLFGGRGGGMMGGGMMGGHNMGGRGMGGPGGDGGMRSGKGGEQGTSSTAPGSPLPSPEGTPETSSSSS